MGDATDTGNQSFEAADAADRDAFLSDMRGSDPAPDDEKPTPPADADADEDDAESADADADADAGDSDAEDAEDDEGEDSDEETEDAEPDADKDRRLAAVQKAERRSRERIAQETSAAHAQLDTRLAQIEKEWKPRIEAAERFEQLRGRVKYDLVGVLTELGMTEDDFEAGGQTLYAHSKAAGVKPEHKAAAQRAARERALADELAATKKRQDDLEKSLRDRDQAEIDARAARQYLASIETAAADKLKTGDARAPLAEHFLAKSPEKTRARLAQIAETLWDETGARPEPAAVLKRFEKQQRADLEEYGIDPTAFLKSAPSKKPIVETKKGSAAAPKNTNDSAKPGGKAEPTTDEDERAAILRELAEMNGESSKKTARA